MLLREFFSPTDHTDNELDSDVNYLDDLKFYIDNHEDLLSKYMFPAIKKQKEHKDHPEIWKVYIRPLQHCADQYCDEFELSDEKHELFSNDKLNELAKALASQQQEYINRGDYK